MTDRRGDSNCVDWKRSRYWCCLLAILFHMYSQYLTKEGLQGSGNFILGGHVIGIWDMVKTLYCLLREKLCCGARLIDWLVLVHAMEWKIMWTRQPSLLQIMINERKLQNLEYFNRLGCLVQYLQVKLNLGFPWQKQDLTTRRRFLSTGLT